MTAFDVTCMEVKAVRYSKEQHKCTSLNTLLRSVKQNSTIKYVIPTANSPCSYLYVSCTLFCLFV